MAEKHNVRLSKALSWLLRHNLHLVSVEITKEAIDPSGYVDVDAVLKLPRQGLRWNFLRIHLCIMFCKERPNYETSWQISSFDSRY